MFRKSELLESVFTDLISEGRRLKADGTITIVTITITITIAIAITIAIMASDIGHITITRFGPLFMLEPAASWTHYHIANRNRLSANTSYIISLRLCCNIRYV